MRCRDASIAEKGSHSARCRGRWLLASLGSAHPIAGCCGLLSPRPGRWRLATPGCDVPAILGGRVMPRPATPCIRVSLPSGPTTQLPVRSRRPHVGIAPAGVLMVAVFARERLPACLMYLDGVPGAWPTAHGHCQMQHPGYSRFPGANCRAWRHFGHQHVHVRFAAIFFN